MRKAADKMKNPISPETKYNYFFIEKSDMKQENMRSNLELATDTEKTILCVHHNLNIQKVSWNPLLVCNIFVHFCPPLSPGQNMVIQGSTLVFDDSLSVFFMGIHGSRLVSMLGCWQLTT